jgi:hypothetical protein
MDKLKMKAGQSALHRSYLVSCREIGAIKLDSRRTAVSGPCVKSLPHSGPRS